VERERAEEKNGDEVEIERRGIKMKRVSALGCDFCYGF
jgi:hypothetical protein